MSKTEPLAFVEPVTSPPAVGGAITPATKCAPTAASGAANGLAAVKHTSTAWRILLIGGAIVGGSAVVAVGVAVGIVITRPDPPGTNPPEPVGGWTKWSQWSDCTATCGLSIRSRQRECEGLSGTCVGPGKQVDDCYEQSCPKTEYGIWSSWSGWSGCSATCGAAGEQMKTRECRKEDGQLDCPGSSTFVRSCNGHGCPSCDRKCPGGGVMRRPECMRCVCIGNQFRGRVTTIYNIPMPSVRVSDAVLPNVALAWTNKHGMFTIRGACNGTRLLFREHMYIDEHHVIGESRRLIPRIKMKQYERLQIAVQPEHKARIEGQSATFCCDVGPQRPGVYYYEWFFNSRLIDPALYNYTKTLRLHQLTISDTGLYKCRASNDLNAVYSDDARLVVEKNRDDFCTPEPRPYQVSLPVGCTYNGLPYIDQGRCGKNMCQRQYMAGGSRQCEDQVPYCCDALSYKETKVFCIGYTMTFYVIENCGCAKCRDPKVTITGNVYDAGSMNVIPYVFIYSNGRVIAKSDINGTFSINLEQKSRTVSIYAKDLFRRYAGAMRVIHITPRHEGIMFINLPMRRYPEKALIASGKRDVMITIGGKNPLAKLVIPANTFYTLSGIPFRGDVAISTVMVDPRQHTDYFHRSADASYIDREGNVQKVQTLGMFALKMTTRYGNFPLQVNGSVHITLDLSYFRAVNTKPKVSFMHPRFGIWERQTELMISNENAYGEFELHPASEWIGFDTELQEMCHSNIRVFKDSGFSSSEVIPGTDVTIVSLRWDQTVSDVSTFRTFTDRNDQEGVCLVHHCDTVLPTKHVHGYILVETPNFSPTKFLQSRSTIQTLTPATKAQLNWQGDQLENYLNYDTYTNISQGSKVVKVNFDYTKVQKLGPYYENTGENHDFRNWAYSEDCTFSPYNPRQNNYFPFYSQFKELGASSKKCDNTKVIPVSEVQAFQGKEQNYKAWFSRSELQRYDVCYIKVMVSANNGDGQVLTATSIVGNISHEGIQAGRTVYGIDQTCVQNARNSEQPVCLEFKHPGLITNGGIIGWRKIDETLLRVAAKSDNGWPSFGQRCKVTSTRHCLQKKYGHKITRPSGLFRNKEFSIYVVDDEYGAEYGIYCSKASRVNSMSEVRSETYRRCLDGRSRRENSQCQGKGSDDPHSVGWAVKLHCD